MNIMRKFSVKPKVDSTNYSSFIEYPVIYVVESESYDYFAFRGNNGNLVMLKSSEITIENVEI